MNQSLSDLITEAPLLENISKYSKPHVYDSEQVLEIQASGFGYCPV